MEKIPVAFIGLGRIASLLEDDPLREKPCTHAGAVAANPDCTIVAGADIDHNRRTLFAKRWHCSVYADAETMIKTHSPQIVIIATGPELHERYCALASEYKVPVIICEKPLADTLKQARRIVRTGSRILVNHERRYSAPYIRAKEVLDSGRLGRLLSIKATLCMGGKNRSLRNVLWNDGTHLIDAIHFLSGSTIQKQSEVRASQLDSKTGTVFLTGTLESSIPFFIEVGAERDFLAFEIDCTSEYGRIQIGNDIFGIWESGPSPYAQGFRSLIKTTETVSGPTGYFINMIADAVVGVRDKNHVLRSSAADGLAVIEYLDKLAH